MVWLIRGAVVETPARHMETGSQVASYLWIVFEDILFSLAPLVWTCSQVEPERMTELPEKVPKRSSGQGRPTSLAEFNSSSVLRFTHRVALCITRCVETIRPRSQGRRRGSHWSQVAPSICPVVRHTVRPVV
jgi:hypothetical protein